MQWTHSMIKEKLDSYYRQFEILCKDFRNILTLTGESNIASDDLYEQALRLIVINYSEFSPLNVIRFFRRDDQLRVEQNTLFFSFASDLRSCLYENQLSSLFKEEFSQEYQSKTGISRLAFSLSDFFEFGSEELFLEKKKELDSLSDMDSLKEFIHNEIKKGFYSLDMFLIHPIESKLRFDHSEYEPGEYQLKYINKWLDGTVTISDIKMNTLVNYVDYIYMQDLPHEVFSAFEEKQSQLFYEELERRLGLIYSDIEDLSEPKKSLTVNSHIRMLDELTRGNVNELLLKRIGDFIEIDNYEEVLLEYDRLLRFSFDDNYKLTIFDHKHYRKYSPTFTAHLIYGYQKKLGAFRVSESQTQKKSIKKIKPVKAKSFGFKGDVQVLKSVLDQLNLKIDLLHPDSSTEDLVTLLISKDYTAENLHIVLGCETVQFSYILKMLKKYFIDLSAVGIERSKCVYSRNNELMTGNNLHGKHPKGVKKQEEIDKIIGQLR